MMVVIGPAEAGAILSLILDNSCPITFLPEIALGGEEQIAGPVGADVVGRDGE
jgi:hypothetical protein